MGKKFEQIGVHFGKTDLERIGLFVEMPYMNGKGYVSPFISMKPPQGKNMMSEGRKSKSATQHGYFDKEFKRIFTGEAIPELGKKPVVREPKKVLPPLIPPGSSKLHGCPGDYFGCFGKYDAFSNLRRPRPPYKKELRNFMISPGKKGGCGYKDITLSRYPDHSYDTYGGKWRGKEYGKIRDGPLRNVHYPQPYFDNNPFKEPKPGPTYVPARFKDKPFRPPGIIMPTGPAKSKGGCQAGCFDKFPAHKPDPYISITEANFKSQKSDKVFHPQSRATKSLYTCSVLNNSTDFKVNEQNYKVYKPNYTKHLRNAGEA